MMCATWAISILLSLPIAIIYKTLEHKDFLRYNLQLVYLSKCTPVYSATWGKESQHIYTLSLIAIMFLVPLILMTFFYIQIALRLWKTTMLGGTGQQDSAQEAQIQSRRKAAKMLIAIVVAFCVCYLPVHLLNVVRYFITPRDEDEKIWRWAALCIHCLPFLNSAINPVIYNFMSAKFRQEFSRICPSSKRFLKTSNRAKRPHENGLQSTTGTSNVTKTIFRTGKGNEHETEHLTSTTRV